MKGKAGSMVQMRTCSHVRATNKTWGNRYLRDKKKNSAWENVLND